MSKSLFYMNFMKQTGNLKEKKNPKTQALSAENCQEASYMCINNNN